MSTILSLLDNRRDMQTLVWRLSSMDGTANHNLTIAMVNVIHTLSICLQNINDECSDISASRTFIHVNNRTLSALSNDFIQYIYGLYINSIMTYDRMRQISNQVLSQENCFTSRTLVQAASSSKWKSININYSKQ